MATSAMDVFPKIILALIVLFLFISELSTADLSGLWNILPFVGSHNGYIKVLG